MTLVLSGTSGVALDSIKNSLMFLETAQATTSGTSINFTGIPSWAKKITVMLNGVSTNGTSLVQIQLGTSGGIETSGYSGTRSDIQVGQPVGTANLSAGVIFDGGVNSIVFSGVCTFSLLTSGTWAFTGVSGRIANGTVVMNCTGTKTLSGTLDRVRLTTTNGTDTFDAGSVNILIEGYV
jgi:hypothetical protein